MCLGTFYLHIAVFPGFSNWPGYKASKISQTDVHSRLHHILLQTIFLSLYILRSNKKHDYILLCNFNTDLTLTVFPSPMLFLLFVAVSIFSSCNCNTENHLHDSRRLQFRHSLPQIPKWWNWACSGDPLSTNLIYSVDQLCDLNAHSLH